MKLIVSTHAQSRLDAQITYIIVQGAPQAALKLLERVEDYFHTTMLTTPQLGKPVPSTDYLERWIPGTKFIVWYRYTDTEIQILDFWHTSQDRIDSDSR